MKYTDIPDLDIKVSGLGFGCLQLGGHGWGKTSEREIIGAIRRVMEGGITIFDSAPIYGLGHSEEMLGMILGERRKDFIIATKVGLPWKKGEAFEKFCDASPANIEREIDMSLMRLKTDYIDLYQLHWPDPRTPVRDTLLTLERLKESGKIRCIGCCNFSLAQLKEALEYGDICTIQLPYNLVDRKIERDLLPFCREKGIAVLAYSPLARGLLPGNYGTDTRFASDDHRSRSNDEYFQAKALPANLMIVDRVKTVADRLNKTPSQVALRWVLDNPAITTAIFGAKTAAQAEDNLAATDFVLSKEDMELLSMEEQECLPG